MLFRNERNKTLWIDLEKPTRDEISETMREVGVGERIENELIEPTPLSLVATEPDAALLIFHLLAPGDADGEARDQEIDIVVGRRFVVTAHYEVISPLHQLQKHFEASGLLGVEQEVETDAVLEVIFSRLFEAMRDHAHHVARRLAQVEGGMFVGRERETIKAISNINRDFLHLEAALASQEEPLTHFLEAIERRAFFGPAFAKRTARILAEREQVARLVATHREVATELRETNIALLNAHQNEIMKVLTVITVIFLPLELIAGIFAMVVGGVPFEGDPRGFVVVGGGMLALAVVLTLFFVRKRWL